MYEEEDSETRTPCYAELQTDLEKSPKVSIIVKKRNKILCVYKKQLKVGYRDRP